MWPTLLPLGPVTLHTYGALIAVGFLAGYFYTVRLARKHGLSADTVTDLCWVALLAGIIGARLLYVAFDWAYYSRSPLSVLKLWEGGLVWYGGFLFAVLSGIFWLRRRRISVLLAADLLAPGTALGHAIGRLGCFAAGCCYGRPTQLPWAVRFTHPDTLAVPHTPLHPSQLYESFLTFGIFAVLSGMAWRRPDRVGRGEVALVYLGLYAAARFVVEFSRGDDRGPVLALLTTTQWISLAFLLAAMAGGVLLRRKNA
ncbi:MAG TPA: prolipoprotein diacylglyceryl transferase [Elusimicrobiota bacterium]|nr:prolipoprotein diacylglyceryl transferase [Elusimicrobiota bacterium]